MRILATVLFATLLGGGSVFLWLYYGGGAGEREVAVVFIDQYVSYNEVATEVEQLVHLPGTEGNTNRSELYSLLDSILTKSMESAQRESLTRLALTNLTALKEEIDSAQISQAKVYQVLQDLDNASKAFSSIDLRTRALDIVTLSRKRAEISARITSILSENNEQILIILTRVLTDKGELTQEHISEINVVTADAEKRFETLEALYSELITKKEEVEVVFKNFIEAAL